ncbi:MAG: 4'-phosphopantetheinyl transferase superfamily protein [Oscillospiraceae bacterium]|nr:4'-phosphopantetheinyl transferase superfamily protein [Oscillospiraceae bacterium]
MLRLYFADVSALDPDSFSGILTDYRREKLSRQRNAQSRRQSLGAELLLRQALADCAPERPWPPEIRLGEYGKPTWNAEGLYFNLSHSGELAACVIADRPVGLDVQKTCVYREALAKRFFTPEEQELLAVSEERDQDFGRIWAMKESYLKARGDGLARPLSSFSVVGKGRERLDAAFWYCRLQGYHFAVCVPGADAAEPDIIVKKLP